jgi:hypothetical protein
MPLSYSNNVLRNLERTFDGSALTLSLLRRNAVAAGSTLSGIPVLFTTKVQTNIAIAVFVNSTG